MALGLVADKSGVAAGKALRPTTASAVSEANEFQAQVDRQLRGTRRRETRTNGCAAAIKNSTPVLPFNAPFRCLGFDGDYFFFLPSRTKQVVKMKAGQLSKTSELQRLAPLAWWRQYFEGQSLVSMHDAVEALLRASEAAGVYDPGQRRGRGVFRDNGRTVLHRGDQLLVDGKRVELDQIKSEFVYEQQPRLPLEIREPATDQESAGLLYVCRKVAWTRSELHARLVAGWCVMASICGGLPWRTHLWLLSESGGGKTWIISHILKPILKCVAISTQSTSTEAGIRAVIGRDRRPVLFDEAESEDQIDRGRIQRVLNLARQASSEEGAPIHKGQPDGSCLEFSVQSCFCFASINLGMSAAADESRTLVVTLGAGSANQFAELQRAEHECLKLGFGERLFARNLRLLPVICDNAEILRAAIVRAGGTSRTGDTLGVVVACYLSLLSADRLNADVADTVVAEEWLQEALELQEVIPNHTRALDYLCQQRLRGPYGTGGKMVDVQVGEAIAHLTETKPEESSKSTDLDGKALSRALEQAGIKWGTWAPWIEKNKSAQAVFLSNTSDQLRLWFKETSWSNWNSILDRVPGAERPGRDFQAIYFAGRRSRFLAVPLLTFLGHGTG